MWTMEKQTSPIVTQLLLKIENLIKTLEERRPTLEKRQAHSSKTTSRSDQVQPVNETTTTPDSALFTTPTGQALSESSESIIPQQPSEVFGHSGHSESEEPSEDDGVVSSKVLSNASKAIVDNTIETVYVSQEVDPSIGRALPERQQMVLINNSDSYYILDNKIADVCVNGGRTGEIQFCVNSNILERCLLPVCENASMSVPFIVGGVFLKPPAKPPEDGCSKGFDCIKFNSSAILDIKSLSWAFIIGVLVHYDGLFIRLKLVGKLENTTMFLKKRQDDTKGLFQFQIDINLNIPRKVDYIDNVNTISELMKAGHFSESCNGLYQNAKLDFPATGNQLVVEKILVWVLHKLVDNAFKFSTAWPLAPGRVACLIGPVAEYSSTFLVKSDSSTVVESAPESMKPAAVVVDEEHEVEFDLLTVAVEESRYDDFMSDINHNSTLDEYLVAGVTVRKVTSNIISVDFSPGVVLNHAETREWRFETQFYAFKGTLRSFLPTVCENVEMSLLCLLVGVTDLIKSWPPVFMKPPARPPDKSLKILHGLISHTNFKLLGILYKHDILYDLHGGLIPMTTSIRGVKFRKRSILCVCESKLVYISGYCNLLDRDLMLFFLTHKLSNKLGLEHALNFLHEVMKHFLLVGSKLGFAKACDAFVELENICGYLAAAMSAAKGPIVKHPHISGTEWGATCTAFCDELVDSVDQVSSDLAETNSDLELNDLLQSVEPHVCLMRHAELYSSSVLNIESFNKGFGDENSKESSILEVVSIVFYSHPGLRHEKLSHEVFQWGICEFEKLSDTTSLQCEDLEQVFSSGQGIMVQEFYPIVKALADNTDVQLNHMVTQIYHGLYKVMVTVGDGRSFVLNTVITIVSIDVLEANLIEMERELLELPQQAIIWSRIETHMPYIKHHSKHVFLLCFNFVDGNASRKGTKPWIKALNYFPSVKKRIWIIFCYVKEKEQVSIAMEIYYRGSIVSTYDMGPKFLITAGLTIEDDDTMKYVGGCNPARQTYHKFDKVRVTVLRTQSTTKPKVRDGVDLLLSGVVATDQSLAFYVTDILTQVVPTTLIQVSEANLPIFMIGLAVIQMESITEANTSASSHRKNQGAWARVCGDYKQADIHTKVHLLLYKLQRIKAIILLAIHVKRAGDINLFLLFSVPRPPEDDDLEDKVILKKGGMMGINNMGLGLLSWAILIMFRVLV